MIHEKNDNTNTLESSFFKKYIRYDTVYFLII